MAATVPLRVGNLVSQLVWIVAGVLGLSLLLVARVFGRAAQTRAVVLDEVRRLLHGGTIERPPGRTTQARGRLGQLEITVELHKDPTRPRQSPMWRVLAVGPVSMDRPTEARVAGWEGWIDPWLQLGETLMVADAVGPGFSLHAERMPTYDHPMVAALRRQGAGLGAGALHVRQDLMRAETRFRIRPEDNRPLFAFLHTMLEVSELPTLGRAHVAGEASRFRVVPEGR